MKNLTLILTIIILLSFLNVITEGSEHKVLNTRQFGAEFSSPAGGEVWTGGSVHTVVIGFNYFGLPGWFSISLYYSADGGSYVAIIENDQFLYPIESIEWSYEWTVPTVHSNNVKLKAVITDGTKTETVYSEVFSIDSKAPSVVSTSPQNGATDVDPSIRYIDITFNEAVYSQSGSITIDNNAQVGGWTVSGNTVRVSVSNLRYGAYYNVSVNGFKDLSDPGNYMTVPYKFTFRTKYDILRSVEIKSPNGGEVWSGGSSHRILVDIVGGTPPFTLEFYLSTDGGVTYPIYIGREVVNYFSCSKYWIVNMTDTNSARVKVIVRDSTGSSKEDTSDGDFFIDSKIPYVVSYYPQNGSDSVPKNAYIYVNFSESMNRTSVERGFSLEVEGGGKITGNISWTSSSSLVFIPDTYFLTNTRYYLNITNAKDVSNPGNVMPPFSITFVTEPILGISLISPTVGFKFTGGTDIAIVWKIRGGYAPYNVTIYFSEDGGAIYNVIGTVSQATAGVGTYYWTLPKIDSANCKIRLNLSDSSGNYTDCEMRGYFIIDSTPPRVSSVLPSTAAVNVSIHTSINIVFSEEMNKTSVQSSLVVQVRGTSVQGTIKWLSDKELVFMPTMPLETNATYWINITGAKDASYPGNLMPIFSSYFKTYHSLWTKFIAPTGREKWSGGFNHTIRWRCGGGMPSYRINILYSKDGGVNYVDYVLKDYVCNAGEHAYSWLVPKINTTSFKLKIEVYDGDSNRVVGYSENIVVDSKSPRVVYSVPKNGEVNVLPETAIEIYFSEEMNRTSVERAFSVECGGKKVSGSFQWNITGKMFKFILSDGMLKPNSTYWINITTDAKDSSTPGNPLESRFSIKFETIRPDDKISPRIVRVFPHPDMSGVPVNVEIEIEFSEAMNKASVERAFRITPRVNGTFVWIGNILKYKLLEPLKCNSTYEVSIGTTAMDMSYNSLQSEFFWRFTTVSSSSNGAVTGFVVNISYSPISNVSVSLLRDGNIVKEVFSNASGYFWIGDISPGEYDIVLKKDGYNTERKKITVNEGSILSLGKIVLTKIDSGGGDEDKPQDNTPKPKESTINWMFVFIPILAVSIVLVLLAVARLTSKRKSRGKERCVYCSEKFNVGDILYRCPECNSIMHAKCSRTLEFCPTCGSVVRKRVSIKRDKKIAEKMFVPPTCKVCEKEFKKGDNGYKCPGCGSVYHVSCLEGKSVCSCGREFPVSSKKNESVEESSNKDESKKLEDWLTKD